MVKAAPTGPRRLGLELRYHPAQHENNRRRPYKVKEKFEKGKDTGSGISGQHKRADGWSLPDCR